MKKSTPITIRQKNEQLICSLFFQHNCLSRADLARMTKLNKASVSEIVENKIKKGFLKEIGNGASSGGRKPVLLSLNAAAAWFLTLDLAPSRISLLSCLLDGSILHSEFTDIPDYEANESPYHSQENLLKAICTRIDTQIANAPETIYGLAGITLSIHGNVFDEEIIFTPYYNLAGMPLKDVLAIKYGVKVSLENEANLAALGELAVSSQYKDFVLLSIRDGIGAGIIQNGKLFRGSCGFSGEIGHMIVVPNGRPCPCGNCGCVEQYASQRSLLRSYCQKKHCDAISLYDFIQIFRGGQLEASQCTQEFIDYLAICCNNLLRTLDPEALIFSSQLLSALPSLLEQVRKTIQCKIRSKNDFKMSLLLDDATLLGGIALALMRFLKLDSISLRPDMTSKSSLPTLQK